MKTRPADTVLAVALALGLHVLLFALALLGLWWTRSTAPAAASGAAVEAELVDARSLSAATRRALAAPASKPAKPAPAPSPPPPPPQPAAQEQLEQPDTVTRLRTTDLPSPLPAAPREDRDRQRQAQVDLTERPRQPTPEQRTPVRAPSPMEQQRLQQLADLRRAREQTTRQSQQAEQRLQQLADAEARAASDRNADQLAGRPPGNPDATDNGLAGRYAEALRSAIRRNWTRPDSVPLGATCTLVIRQIPGGEVVEVKIGSPCAYDAAGQRSIEAAVWKAQPLPYAGFEPVFARTLTLNFTAADQ